jgi:hypothetical protein
MRNLHKKFAEVFDLQITSVDQGCQNLCKIFEVSDTAHLCSMNERKTNLMQLLYILIVAVGDALYVSGVFAHRQER